MLLALSDRNKALSLTSVLRLWPSKLRKTFLTLVSFDRLRSAYPCSDRSKNAGFVWSPCVAQDELQQGLGVSIKVTVVSDHFREPLVFTCDGSSTVDLLIYQTLCYAHEDLDLMDVEDYLLKVCGQGSPSCSFPCLHPLQVELPLHVERLVQSVKALCSSLAAVETPEITTALNQLPACPCRLQPHVQKVGEALLPISKANTVKVQSEINFFFKSANFILNKSTVSLSATLFFHSYEGFFLSCSLTHGGVELCAPQHTSKKPVNKYLFHLVVWDQRICFPVRINQLPRETQLTVTLYATLLPPPGSVEDKNKQRRSIEALAATPHHCLKLTCNVYNPLILLPPCLDKFAVVALLLYPPFGFCPIMTCRLTQEDRRLLWEKRYFCHAESSGLPLVLASAPSWEWACLPDVYALLRQWSCMNHLDALGLLHATFPDQELRRTAVQWMDSMSDPELLDFLPQLVQALKYECYLDSPLVRFLLRRAIGDIRIAHYLFWLLKDALQDSQFSVRHQYLLAALLCCSGRGLREEFDRQCWLVNILAKVAQRVRDASPSSRQAILREGLEEVRQYFSISSSCRLPLNPGLQVKGINIQSCSYFNSNAVPLKLSFQNLDSLGDNINVIFKSGDDLRQDMLTLQIIRIMNKIWIQEGLDMRMVNFRCFSTGRGRGMVEMIPNAETLRKIQVEHGVTGSFKDRPLADWLQKHNPTEDEYEKAVENFIYSCAGCCVATYILGICDRHNDNIMLKTSGHMFHIDFGKFLGHAQMFGNIKRDRAPFVFTSDMAYVINGGDKPSSRFHDFVDLCCEAYNLIRKHTHLFLNLLGLMLSCGIPELSDLQDLKYVYDALRPHESEADATMYFTRLIESSLGSVATKLNFFIHNLAQMKFASTEERPVLSFAPRVHTLKSDGLIRNLYVCRHIRTYSPSKGYTYVVKVEWDGQQGSTLVQRSFEEFHELHSKLRLIFPSSKLPSFPSRFVIGRSRGETMADRRKDELNGYVWHLIHAAPEVAECDLIYTFFHPLPRDERPGTVSNTLQNKTAGEVKLSISYKSDKLFIMVMHIRGLQVLQDGTDPDPYVKLYLLPDPQKTSKRKTKAAKRTCNPTYNEMLVYDGIPRGDLHQRVIHLRVLSEGAFWENTLLGETFIPLKALTPGYLWVDWHQLGTRGPDSTR
uniref:Phosphatidylinositol-4-phosphate 3-kinase catalytic subunit type 2 beta n=1 Tax=Scleropages formosus TaxID=113540 RepID=A0A8C9WFT0_SCLFO